MPFSLGPGRMAAVSVVLYASLVASGLSRLQHALLATGKPIPNKGAYSAQQWPMQRSTTYDVAVVLGHALDRNGRPSRVLAERIDRAVDLFNRGVVKHVLFSGGHDGSGLKGRPSEAESMLRYALSDPQVPPPEDPTWLLEEGSTSTRTNALLSLQMAKERGLHSAVVVTSGFHQFRSGRVFRRVAKGLADEDGVPFQLRVVDVPNEQIRQRTPQESGMVVEGHRTKELIVAQLNWFRELLAISYYFVRGWL